MTHAKGELIAVLGYRELAAVTTEDYYFPPGRHDSVGIVDLPGAFRDITLKGWCVQSSGTNIQNMGVAVQYVDGTIKWISGNGANILIGTSVGHTIARVKQEIELRDVRNIIIRVRNSHASNALYVAAYVAYEPIK